MTNLEKLYRARELIESRTGGRQQLALGWDGMPAVRIEDPCMVGVYFALIKNMLTGMYDSRVKGYIRTCGGYRPGARMKDLTEECAQIASLVLDLEKMEISVTTGRGVVEKRIYKLMDAKGRVLIPKELRVETGIGYGDIVALEIADGKVTLRKVTVIEPGDQSPETVEAFVRAAFRTMPDRLRLSLISDLSGLLNEEKTG